MLLADQEAQLAKLKKERDSLREQVESLKSKADQAIQSEKEKADLEARICELGGVIDKLRHKEGKMKVICDKFKSQLKTSASLNDRLKLQVEIMKQS